MDDRETIAAIATPPGEGAIGIVRLSGDKTVEIGQKILRNNKGKHITSWPEKAVRIGTVVNDKEEIIDQVVFFIFKRPHSYTGEDILEIHGHGGEENLKQILSAVIKAGARPAEPGEFTKRAFLNGRMDLSQAEAVIDLIRAQTDLAHKAAVQQLSGKLSACVNRLEEQLMKILVPIEAALDYPEDEIPDIERDEVIAQMERIIDELEKLIKTADKGRILRETATVVLAGRPNVGKSSLLNAMLGEERAIVTPIPGTTRDFVSEVINLDGLPVRMVDTAGLREIEDPIEKEGVSRSWKWIKQAEIILFVIDSALELTDEEKDFLINIKGQRVIIILNKSDLPPKTEMRQLTEIFPNLPVLTVSTKTEAGIADLRKQIRELLVGKDTGREFPVMVTRIRHQSALEEALQYLLLVKKALAQDYSEDLITVDLRAALESLGEITGRTVSEEIINAIFKEFCVGK